MLSSITHLLQVNNYFSYDQYRLLLVKRATTKLLKADKIDVRRMSVYCVNKCFQMVWINIWINSMAKICYIALGTKRCEHFLHRF